MKAERIRDPIHDLIEFSTDEFERQCWKVVQTPPFQRLRRIKQLGFSEFVYPGATHSRLAHSLGVFNTARQLAAVVKSRRGAAFDAQAANLAVASALVHDVGHGPFSHAFEGALKGLRIGRPHEEWTEKIVLETEVRDALEGFVPAFSTKVASLFERETPADIYSSIVSSQFDADRTRLHEARSVYDRHPTGRHRFSMAVGNISRLVASKSGRMERTYTKRRLSF